MKDQIKNQQSQQKNDEMEKLIEEIKDLRLSVEKKKIEIEILKTSEEKERTEKEGLEKLIKKIYSHKPQLK